MVNRKPRRTELRFALIAYAHRTEVSHTMPKRALICTAILFLSLVAAALAGSIRPVAGPVILARSGAQSTYLWDASPYVAQLVTERNVDDAGMRAIEATAVTILRDKAASSRAKTLILRIVYTRSGAVSPVYGTLTFAGVEKLATLTAARDAIEKRG